MARTNSQYMLVIPGYRPIMLLFRGSWSGLWFGYQLDKKVVVECNHSNLRQVSQANVCNQWRLHKSLYFSGLACDLHMTCIRHYFFIRYGRCGCNVKLDAGRNSMLFSDMAGDRKLLLDSLNTYMSNYWPTNWKDWQPRCRKDCALSLISHTTWSWWTWRWEKTFSWIRECFR